MIFLSSNYSTWINEMPLIDYRKDANSYANLYAELDITGTIYLAFRDLPQILAKYVSGKRVLDYTPVRDKECMNI